MFFQKKLKDISLYMVKVIEIPRKNLNKSFASIHSLAIGGRKQIRSLRVKYFKTCSIVRGNTHNSGFRIP